jgi:hypothetical protein
MRTTAFPLHRTEWSLTQVWAQPVGIVLAGFVGAVGLMSAAGVAREHDARRTAAVVAAVTVGVAVGVYLAGRRFGRLSARDGMLVVFDDHLEISDSQLLDRTVVVGRQHVLDVTQPGVTGTGPQGSWRDQAFVGLLVRDHGRANVEIWLTEPVLVPQAPVSSGHRATVLQLRTPGAAVLLRWFRPDPHSNEKAMRWYERPFHGVRWY